MPRTVLAPVVPSFAGTPAPLEAPTLDGDVIPTGDVRLLVECGATGTTVTIPTTATVDGLAVTDAGGTVAPGTVAVFGPFPHRLFAQPLDAIEGAAAVLVDYSSVTDVTRTVLA